MKEFDNSEIENKLCQEDLQLFRSIENSYFSENEKIFFEKMFEKIQTECAPCREVLLNETENKDSIFILRDGYDEFIIGVTTNGIDHILLHTMCLTEALNANLKQIGILSYDVTLLQWLRARDYKGIMYNHNNAYL